MLSTYEMTFGNTALGASLFFDKLYNLQLSSRVLDGQSRPHCSLGDTKANAARTALAYIGSGFHSLDVYVEPASTEPAADQMQEDESDNESLGVCTTPRPSHSATGKGSYVSPVDPIPYFDELATVVSQPCPRARA